MKQINKPTAREWNKLLLVNGKAKGLFNGGDLYKIERKQGNDGRMEIGNSKLGERFYQKRK